MGPIATSQSGGVKNVSGMPQIMDLGCTTRKYGQQCALRTGKASWLSGDGRTKSLDAVAELGSDGIC